MPETMKTWLLPDLMFPSLGRTGTSVIHRPDISCSADPSPQDPDLDRNSATKSRRPGVSHGPTPSHTRRRVRVESESTQAGNFKKTAREIDN